MACVHNMMIRGLNSIYRQAPHIKPQDVKSFLGYSACFYELITVHHAGEEDFLFPKIEEMSGDKGIMDHNVEQHHAFHNGIEKYNDYIKACLSGTETYDGAQLTAIIDDFGKILADHLRDEIPTLIGLAQYGDKMDKLEKIFEEFSDRDTVSSPIHGSNSIS